MKALLLCIFLQGSLSDDPFVSKILGNKAKTTCKKNATPLTPGIYSVHRKKSAHIIGFPVVNLGNGASDSESS